MEATGEDLGLLHKIRPPKLEDAGLEDCALPPDSIHQAFLKAASAVGSRAVSILSSDDDGDACVSDPWPEISQPSDTLLGITPERGPPPGPCATDKGGAWMGDGEGARDVVGERNEGDAEKKDEVIVVGEESRGEKSGDCVDGLKGLKIQERENEVDDDEANEKKPSLVEGYFINP